MPQAIIGKLLFSEDDTVYFLMRFTDDSSLQMKFYDLYSEPVDNLLRIVKTSATKDEILKSLEDNGFKYSETGENWDISDLVLDVSIYDEHVDEISDFEIDYNLKPGVEEDITEEELLALTEWMDEVISRLENKETNVEEASKDIKKGR